MKSEAETRGSDRASIEVAMHELYKDLAERSGQSEDAPFFLMMDVFMWAVTMGVKAGEKRPLSGQRTQPFRWSQLSQDLDVPMLKAIAVADSGDVEIILREDKILRIAEEYANYGIRELKRELVDKPGQSLWNLVDLLGQSSE